MQTSTATGTGWEGDDKEGEKQTRSCAGMWFKSLDLKTTSAEKLAIMEFPENFLCPTKGPEKPQCKFLETTVMRRSTR